MPKSRVSFAQAILTKVLEWLCMRLSHSRMRLGLKFCQVSVRPSIHALLERACFLFVVDIEISSSAESGLTGRGCAVDSLALAEGVVRGTHKVIC